MSGSFRPGGLSPFLTERARVRAPRVIEYAAAGGAAMLLAPDGQIVLCEAVDVDLERIARTVVSLGETRAPVSFRLGMACVYAAPVCREWMLCTVSLSPIAPAVASERLRKAAHVLALALDDGAPGSTGGSHGGAPAHAFARAPS